MMCCSLICLSLCEISMNKPKKCDQCDSKEPPNCQLTTLNIPSINYFCSDQCLQSFLQSELAAGRGVVVPDHRLQPMPTDSPNRIKGSQLLQHQMQQTKDLAENQSSGSAHGATAASHQPAKQQPVRGMFGNPQELDGGSLKCECGHEALDSEALLKHMNLCSLNRTQ